MAITTANTISKQEAKKRLASVWIWEEQQLKQCEREVMAILAAIRKAKANVGSRRRMTERRSKQNERD